MRWKDKPAKIDQRFIKEVCRPFHSIAHIPVDNAAIYGVDGQQTAVGVVRRVSVFVCDSAKEIPYGHKDARLILVLLRDACIAKTNLIYGNCLP